MKEYKRFTTKNWQKYKHTKAYERLAELEDDIEDGKLINKDEFIDIYFKQNKSDKFNDNWGNIYWVILLAAILSGNTDIDKLPQDVKDEINKLKEKDNGR